MMSVLPWLLLSTPPLGGCVQAWRSWLAYSWRASTMHSEAGGVERGLCVCLLDVAMTMQVER